jgi:glycosyltransferase involved in cell wall biosynthesis
MKILFDHPNPFLLAHGGFQIQIEQTKAALEKIGVEVEYLRWWDDSQTGDIIHYFGLPSLHYLHQSAEKKMRVVCTHLLTNTCNRSDNILKLQGLLHGLLMKTPGWGLIKNQTTWPVLHQIPLFVVGLEAEKQALIHAFGIQPEKIRIVPLGLHQDFLSASPPPKSSPWLVTTGTITERKNSLLLAKWAKRAKVPLLFVGKPYSNTDPYWLKFKAEIDQIYVFHQSHVSDRKDLIQILGQSKGFVLFSHHENWCLSAHEALACGLNILVQDQKWSRERFGNRAYYWPSRPDKRHPEILQNFFKKQSSTILPEVPQCSWVQVARELVSIYESRSV